MKEAIIFFIRDMEDPWLLGCLEGMDEPTLREFLQDQLDFEEELIGKIMTHLPNVNFGLIQMNIVDDIYEEEDITPKFEVKQQLLMRRDGDVWLINLGIKID